MAITNGDYIQSSIPNASILEKLKDGSLYAYSIEAEDGYVLHDNRIDEEEFDLETTRPTGNLIPRFKTGSTTVSVSYDFKTTTNGTYTYTDENNMEATVPVVKIGVYEFYTLPEDIVPINQICGGDIDYEII